MSKLFPFHEALVLENDRVKLRALTQGDVSNLRDFSEQEPDLWQYSIQSAAGETNLQMYIDKALKDKNEGNAFPFIVYDKIMQEYAGCTRFYDIQLQHSCLQLGYTWYGKKFQGTGLNVHCKYLLLSFVFENLGFERVEARADVLNKRSIAAMKKIGFVEEGILRNNALSANGMRRDSMVLSILKLEWQNEVKKKLINLL